MKYGYNGLIMMATVMTVNGETFNYGHKDYDDPNEGGTSYSQKHWDRVKCDNFGTCDGYPEKFPNSIGFSVEGDNKCRWCKAGEKEKCGLHRQSPIDLLRDRAVIGDPMEKECPDWHFMRAEEGACTWSDFEGQFRIERHALELYVPTLENGDVDCVDSETQERKFPRIDYSKGFPDWFWFDHTSITVPSSHTQQGKRYDAEVILAHFYEIKHVKNQLGYVSIFLDAYKDAESWPYLDKLICQWRKVEEETRAACGLDPAPPYGRCSLFRNQEPTEEWLQEEAGLGIGSNTFTPSESPAPESSSPSSSSLPSSLVSTPSQAPITFSSEAPIPGTNSSSSPSSPSSSVPTLPSLVPIGARPNDDLVFDCDAYDVNYGRMCDSFFPCCETLRSETDFCWDLYENIFPGDLIYSACSQCCGDNGPKVIGPPAPVRDDIPKTKQCFEVDSAPRICSGCCNATRSVTSFCESVYDTYESDIQSICYYCCSEPKLVGPAIAPVRQLLRGGERVLPAEAISKAAGSEIEEAFTIPEGAKVTYVHGRRILLREENYRESTINHEEEFAERYADFKHRQNQAVVHEENYDDVPFTLYEWLMKVETEYYFRYEGSQIVPPCWDVVHWRTLKDPARVAKRQIEELNRLLAWRVSPSGDNECELESAGRVSKNGNKVDLDRDIQYYHLQHRMVFCECKDWPSKFPGDDEWCATWREGNGTDRLYDNPYSFNSNGKW